LLNELADQILAMTQSVGGEGCVDGPRQRLALAIVGEPYFQLML
jgi:hypothetical protein